MKNQDPLRGEERSVSRTARRRGIPFSCCVLALSIAAFGGAPRLPQEGFSPQDFLNYEFIRDPQISPDGKTIIYVRNFSDMVTDRYCSNLWMINFDGTENRPLDAGPFREFSPRWSPDGKRIIYLSDKGGKLQIRERWMDTGQSIALDTGVYTPNSISWSPDGRWVSFFSAVPSAPAENMVILPPAPPDAKWAPAASVTDRIMYRNGGPEYNHLFILPAEGGTPRQLTSGEYQFQDCDWASDGKSVVVSANMRTDWEMEILDTDIYEISLWDGSRKRLTRRYGPDESPRVSPNGKLIAYTGYDDGHLSHQPNELWVMNRDGSCPRSLTKDLDRDVSRIQWGADGKSLLFIYHDKGTTYLAEITLGGKISIISGELGDGQNCGSSVLLSYSMAPNGYCAYTHSGPDHPSDLAVGTMHPPFFRVLTNVNDDILAGKKVSRAEEIRYPSSLDGREIQGWILKPPDFDSSKKYPLILEIHGGPFYGYGDRFDIEKQLMAASGYVVLYVNPRGSTGYGKDFANLIHHAYPGDDFFDLNSGIDEVVKRGYVNKDEIFVAGGSGGGVLTCWMIGKTDRFRAAVTLYPVINWTSWILTVDLPGILLNYWFPGTPWEYPEHYAKRSPLSVVGNVKTPTMVICGEQDGRTPIYESEQYYRALKIMGVESVFVRFPQADHGLSGRPTEHLSKVLHILAWFDRHRMKTPVQDLKRMMNEWNRIDL